MIDYVFVPYLEIIPEWVEYYYDHQTIRQMLLKMQVCKLVSEHLLQQNYVWTPPTNQNLKQLDTRLNSLNGSMLNSPRSPSRLMTSRTIFSENQQKIQKVRQIFDQYAQICMQYCNNEQKIFFVFCQLKQFEIRNKFIMYRQVFMNVKNIYKLRNNFIILIQNLFIECYYLLRALTYNIENQHLRNQLLSQQLTHFNFGLNRGTNKKLKNTGSFSYWRYRYKGNVSELNRLLSSNIRILQQIQLSSSMYHHEVNQSSYRNIKKINMKKSSGRHADVIVVGLATGGIIALIAVIVFIQLTKDIDIQNQTMRNHFPAWRAGSYIILYFWILGISILFYQKSKINYRLIFHLEDHNMPSSHHILAMAGVFSFIYLTLFIINSFFIVGLINLKFLFIGEMFLFGIIIYAMIPYTVIKNRNQLFILKMLFRVVTSPCFPISYFIVWVSQQLVSMAQPAGDLFYSICFIAKKESAWCQGNSANFITVFSVTMFIFRIIQSLKLFHQNTMKKPDKRYDFRDGPFLGFIRGSLGLTTALISMLRRLKIINSITVWIVISAITTLYSWFIDVTVDWGLINLRQKTIMSRKLLFPEVKGFYIFAMFFDLILRSAWVLTISAVFDISGSLDPLLFTMIICYLQIVRRCFWNILNVQFQHIQNVENMRVTINDDKYFEQMKIASNEIKIQKLQKSNKNILNEVQQYEQNLKQKKRRQIRQMLKVHINKRAELLTRIEQFNQYFEEAIEQITPDDLKLQDTDKDYIQKIRHRKYTNLVIPNKKFREDENNQY